MVDGNLINFIFEDTYNYESSQFQIYGRWNLGKFYKSDWEILN